MTADRNSETILAIDLGGTKLLGTVINRSAEILLRQQVPAPQGNAAVVETISILIAQLLGAAKRIDNQPVGIAIGAPGFIDTQNGVVVDADNLHIKSLSLTKPINSYFHLPTCLYHDMKAATLGEALYGAGVGHDYFAYLNIGTGVAVGLYLDGKVYQGRAGRAGEIGHFALQAVGAGKPCGLDQRLEMLVSGPALAARATEALIQAPKSLIRTLAEGNRGQVTPHILAEAAQQGDDLAVQIIAEAADKIGFILGGLLDVLDLECVILGGGVAQMGESLLMPIQNSVARYAIETVPILPSSLGGDAGAIGVAAAYFNSGE